MDERLRFLDVFSPPDIEQNACEQFMRIIALSLAMLEPKLLDKIQVEDAVSPSGADIVAQSFSERVGSVRARVKIGIEQVSGPKRERSVKATLGSMASFAWEKFLECIH